MGKLRKFQFIHFQVRAVSFREGSSEFDGICWVFLFLEIIGFGWKSLGGLEFFVGGGKGFWNKSSTKTFIAIVFGVSEWESEVPEKSPWYMMV